jgi:hypothetical protein
MKAARCARRHRLVVHLAPESFSHPPELAPANCAPELGSQNPIAEKTSARCQKVANAANVRCPLANARSTESGLKIEN